MALFIMEQLVIMEPNQNRMNLLVWFGSRIKISKIYYKMISVQRKIMGKND